MIKFFSLLATVTLLTTTIYHFSVNDIDGNAITLSQYQGKKILFVNTASNSSYTGQYAGLEQLYQKYKDSLVIIAVPSNSFDNDSADNATIKGFVMSNYNIHYILTQKTDVTGDAQSPVYSWLTHMDQNTMMDNTIDADFYKFLVDSSGRLIGIFAPSVDPMSDDIQNAITN